MHEIRRVRRDHPIAPQLHHTLSYSRASDTVVPMAVDY